VHSIGTVGSIFFSSRVAIGGTCLLDQQIVGATSLNAFKNGLDKLRKTKMGFFTVSRTDTLSHMLLSLDCHAGEAIIQDEF